MVEIIDYDLDMCFEKCFIGKIQRAMKKMKIRYIKYDEKHKEKLCEMIKDLYLEDPEGEPISQQKIEATILQGQYYAERLQIYLMEDENNKIAGYVIIQLIWSNEWGGLTANIDEMFVVRDMRNQGIATGFIQCLRELIPQINRITLEVTPSNNKALQLYRRLGFRNMENQCCELIIAR